MDEETKTYLDAMMVQINTKLDDILDKLSAVRLDTDGLKGHVIYTLGDQLTLSQRITKLEDELRRRD
jgi:hypothetical protein